MTEQKTQELATQLESTVARIVAAVEEIPEEEQETSISAAAQNTVLSTLRQRITDLETENTSLRTQLAAQADSKSQITNHQSQIRKTIPALVNTLLAKSNIEINDGMDTAALDSALSPLSMEQRIAVKMQMARAGLIA